MEIAILFLLILLNGIFAMSEIALVTARKARLQKLIDANDGAAIAAANEHKRLVLRFVRDVSRDDLTGAFNDGFRRNAGGSLGALQARINRLNGWMGSVVSGNELTFTYLPGTGLRVHTGSTARGIIEGEDFARVFFSIWLGPNPPNTGLRRGLLGGSCD